MKSKRILDWRASIVGHGPQSLRQLKNNVEGDGIMGAEYLTENYA